MEKQQPEWAVKWTPIDLQQVAPNWTLTKCELFLDFYFDSMSERMIEQGWEILHYFVQDFGKDFEVVQ